MIIMIIIITILIIIKILLIIIVIIITFPRIGKKNHCMHQGSQRNTISISTIIVYDHPTG